MACSVFTTTLVILILSASLLSFPSESRKLLGTMKVERTNQAPLKPSSLLSSLPKGTVPSSTPSKKGHAFVVDEKLIARHLSTLDGRVLLNSIPSPGVGN